LKEAAARGNEEAVKMLPHVLEREAREVVAEARLELAQVGPRWWRRRGRADDACEAF
jgi:hypothetical protein